MDFLKIKLERVIEYSTSMCRHLSPRYGKVILISEYPVLTAVN